MEKWMDEGTKEPNDKELEAIFKQRVDDDYIQIAKTRDHIPASKIKWIEQWKGLTVSEALDRQCKDLGI
jgi:hypothetical protein